MFCSIARRLQFPAVLALSLLAATRANAVPQSETLLPDTTKGVIFIPDVDRMEAQWNKTQLGIMMNDPVMQPFTEDLKRQFKEKWTRVYDKLGLTIDDLKDVPSGEVAFGLIQPTKTTAALAVVADVTGKRAEADELLGKIDRNMTKQKAVKSERDVDGVNVITYTLPKEPGEAAQRKAVFFIHQDTLCGSDDPAIANAILGRFAGDSEDSLATLPAFKSIMARAADSAGQLAPEIRWFVEPFGYVEASRIANPPKTKKRGKDMLKILASQGFTAIQGIGGYIHFYVDDKYEIIHRTAMYAPAVEGVPADEKYTLAARMLRFPNGGDHHPLKWVPRELSSYISMNVDIPRSFEYSSTLVDAYIGEEGTFDEVIKSLEIDPNGPRIDVRKDLIAHLGQHCTIVTDSALPITPKCERIVVGVEATNPEALAKTIEKTMKTDPDARRINVAGHTVWEIVQDDMDLPDLAIDGGFDPIGDGGGAPQKRKLPNSAVCVAHGHLIVATHIDFLKKVLAQAEERETLAESVDYRIVMSEMNNLFGDTRSFRFFSRTDEEYRPTFELIRMGKMPESQSVLGKVLNAVFGEGKEGEVRSQKIDGSQLPEFETVRRYFGPAGMQVVSEEDGWFILGMTLRKDMR